MIYDKDIKKLRIDILLTAQPSLNTLPFQHLSAEREFNLPIFCQYHLRYKEEKGRKWGRL